MKGDHRFLARAHVEQIEITEMGSATREFLDVEHGVVPMCFCGWQGNERENLLQAKWDWATFHMGYPRAVAESVILGMDRIPLTESEKKASQRRKKEIVDRFTRM